MDTYAIIFMQFYEVHGPPQPHNNFPIHVDDRQVGCGNAAGLCEFSLTSRATLGLWSNTMLVLEQHFL